MWALTETSTATVPSESLDLDGDGLINKIDRDDDNDGIVDYFDQDSNANKIDDYLEATHDQYFSGYIKSVTSDIEVVPVNNTLEYYLRFLVKLNLPLAADKIRLVGPA